MKTAYFRFDDMLAPLLPKPWHLSHGIYSFSGPQSVKHLIESLGIPHTEILGIQANGNAADLGYLVRDADTIEVAGVSKVHLTGEPSFIIDGHLGRLKSSLRMLGFDCEFQVGYSDDRLAELAAREGRVLLSRDRRLLMRKVIQHGCLLRSLDPDEQLEQVMARFALAKWAHPFRRCIRCNDLLRPVAKEAIIERLEPLTKKYFDEFRICDCCGQVYWKGSHFERMRKEVARLVNLGLN